MRGQLMKQLFEHTVFNNIELKNRLIRAATWEWLADEKGHLTDNLIRVYENLADGGVGMIITGYAYVLEQEQPNPCMMGIYDDSFIDEYTDLTRRVHEKGSRIIMQIVYGGAFTFYKSSERKIWGPSAVEHRISKVTPAEMTSDDIAVLIDAFGDAALRVKKSGFDGVEIHGGHGYLLNLFLSPFYNLRTDEYGGSSQKRARIIYDVYKKIREKTGDDFTVMIKLNCSDFMNGKGQTFEETREICRNLSSMGIDAIEISGGPVFKKPKYEKDPTGPLSERNESFFSEHAAIIAEEADVPVILVGGNRSVGVMEEILNSSKIKYFSLCRPLISEPDLVNKWEKQRDYKPRCTSCQKCFNPGGNTCILDREAD